MNILFMPVIKTLAIAEGAGGLFDFNATLPLIAIQFILLTVALTFIFYKPVAKVIDEREAYINGNLNSATEKLIKTDELYKAYEQQLKIARTNAQSIIEKSEKAAKAVVADEINQARLDATKLIEQTNKELEAQKSIALHELETQVEELSQLIKEKLLGKEVVL
jgi:F-type H+-transporting ATPase subunit b